MRAAIDVRPKKLIHGRLAAVLALIASTVVGTVGMGSAQAADPTLPAGPTPVGRPWSGTLTETNRWTTANAGQMRWMEFDHALDGSVSQISLACSGTEKIRLTTTGDGEEHEFGPGYATVPVLAQIAANDSCQGTYLKWTEGGVSTTCELSATWSVSGSVTGVMGFNWRLNDQTDPSQGGRWEFGGGNELDFPTPATGMTDPCGAMQLYDANLGIVSLGYQATGPGVPPESLVTGTHMSGTYQNTRAPWGGGSGDGNDETQTYAYDFTYTGAPPEPCTSGTSAPGDADGDRLPDEYETNVLGTDSSNPDTDGDCFGDAREVASGSSATNTAQTPNTLPSGVAPTNLLGRGHAGITCGTTLFRWVSPALQSLGVDSGRKGCIMLLSNSAANAVLDYSIEYGPNITTTLMRMTRPQLLEISGQPSIDWVQEATVHSTIWSTKAVVKKMMAQSMNLTRLNTVFTVAKLAALSGVPYGALWGVNQVRNKNACIQVRLGNAADGTSRLSWSLIYSAENLTNEGLEDGLHRAGVWKKKVRRYLPDTAERRSTNLICKYGRPVATGAGAGQVFDSARSFIF